MTTYNFDPLVIYAPYLLAIGVGMLLALVVLEAIRVKRVHKQYIKGKN